MNHKGVPGGYSLTDQTYAKLLRRIAKDPMKTVPEGLKQDILRYYADEASTISSKRDRKRSAQVEEQLRRLLHSHRERSQIDRIPGIPPRVLASRSPRNSAFTF